VKKLRGYLSSRVFMGERLPQSAQNIILKDYCNKNDYILYLSTTEYVMQECYLVLNKTINKDDIVDGIVMYSLFQLPKDENLRLDLFKKAMNKKIELHFAIENLFIKNHQDINLIENIWKVKKNLNLFDLNLLRNNVEK